MRCQNVGDVWRKLDIANREEFAYNELAENGSLESIAHQWTMHEMDALAGMLTESGGPIVKWSDDWFFGYSMTFGAGLIVCLNSPLRSDYRRTHSHSNQRVTLKGDDRMGKWQIIEHLSNGRVLMIREGFLGRIVRLEDVSGLTGTIEEKN